MVFYGVSKSGKSTAIIELIKRRRELFDKPIHKVIYLYAVDQPAYKALADDKDVIFSKNPSVVDQYIAPNSSIVVVFDDYMLNAIKDPTEINQFFTVKGHHFNLVNIYSQQNIFNDKTRILNNNVDYAVFMPFLRNGESVLRYFTQIDSSNAKHMFKAYKYCTRLPYTHFVISFHPLDHGVRYRSSLFINNELVIFRPRDE